MMRRKWLFWLPEERENPGSAPSSHTETEACREWTPFLTALFDGEADEDGALQARRHLLVCERCARAWMDWNQTRSLLINHSAPPPPPSLLWRIRLACRLGHPTTSSPSPSEPALPSVPDFSAQIFARTTRQNTKPTPAFGFAGFQSLSRGLRANSPFIGAFAMGVFVLFVARDSLTFSTTPAPLVTNAPVTVAQAPRTQARPTTRVASAPRARQDAAGSKLRPVASRPSMPRAISEAEAEAPTRIEKSAAPSALVSLERARRERESLAPSPIRLASFNVEANEPLPMLPAPRPVPVVTKRVERVPQPVRAPKLARLPRIALRPVASAPQTAPPVMLASYEPDASSVAAPEPTSAPAPRVRRGRVLLASAPQPTTPLRISAPHALPITFSQPSASDSDDAGLDELDSTVQEYRSTFADDASDFSSDFE